MTASAKQLTQRREMNVQTFGKSKSFNATYSPNGNPGGRRKPGKPRCTTFVVPRKADPVVTGNANIGTDDDVKAYCARMGYVYETTTKTKESNK